MYKRQIPNRVIDRDMEFSMNMCRERVSEERIWADRAVKFCGEGGAMRSSQREALWRVVEGFRGVFAGEPGRAKGYKCELKVREHAPYVQRSYPVPYSKRGAVQLELDRMLEGGIIAVSYTHLDVYKRQLTWLLLLVVLYFESVGVLITCQYCFLYFNL